MNKRELSEADICDHCITPALEQAGWPKAQIRREYTLTQGRIIVRGKLVARGKRKRADYVLFHHPNQPIAVIEAKDNKHSIGAGMQQALGYADLLDVPFIFSSNGDGFLLHDRSGTYPKTEQEMGLDAFPSPDELWERYKQWRQVEDVPETLLASRYYPSTEGKEPRYYQQLAINRTIEAIGKGQKRCLLVMATGTGKTYTAIGAMRNLLQEYRQRDHSLLVVITVPMTHLAKQWAESLADFDYLSPKLLYGSHRTDWKSALQSLIDDMELGLSEAEIIITTHQTGSTSFFRQQVRSADCDSLVIADEVHNLGAEHRRKGLVQEFDYRLGLSATPERFYDEEGTEFLFRYFDKTVFEFTLSDAIPEYLTPYEYYPRIVEMDGEELGRYRKISHKLARLSNSDDTDIEETRERLLTKRANILKSARRKYDELEAILDEIDIDHLLVYTNFEQIDEVQKRMADRGVVQHRFTAEEDDEERQRLLTAFAEGRYEALVAMKCLDEGVDVPSTRQAILMANSRNPKEFVQRRGRVLRQHSESGKEKAVIYDMVVVPTTDPDAELAASEKGILTRELERFEEFAATSLNEDQARLALQDIRREFEV